MDATHVEAAVRAKSVPQILRELTKGMRKEIYKYEYDLSEKFPDKPSLEADVEEEIAYTRRLLENIREGVVRSENEKRNGPADQRTAGYGRDPANTVEG